MFLLKKELKGIKRFFIILQSIYGVGKVYSLYLCSRVGMSIKGFLLDLNYEGLRVLSRCVLKEGVFEVELYRLKLSNIKNKIAKKCYVGKRHHMHLPVRGQNTKNNRKTAKKGQSLKLF